MGKGARTRVQSAEKFKERKEQAKIELNKQKKNKLIVSVVAIVLAVIVAASALTYVFYYQNGEYLRKQTAVESTNYKLDNAMMLYFFNQNFNSIYNYYGAEYFTMLTGVDLGISLKAQQYSENATWFDYILENTKASVQSMLYLAEAANVVGFNLSAEEKMMLKERADALDTSGYSSKLNNDDYGRALEFTALTSMYQEFLLDAYVTDEASIIAEYEENSKNYDTVDYRRFAISFSEKEDSDLPTKAEAEEMAAELAKAKNEKEFLLKVETLVKSTDTDITEADLQTTLDNTLFENQYYEEGSEFSEWLFNEERKVNDVHTYKSDSVSAIAVSILTSERSRDEENTVDSRHILFATTTYGSEEAAKAKAEEVLKEWESGEKTGESFGKLAFKYTDDMGSLYTYGLYENTRQGTMVPEYDSWIFDEDRKEGDAEIVKTDFGYHIIYFEGEGLEGWETLVLNNMLQTYLESQIGLYAETFQVIFHEGVLRDLPV